MLTLAYHSDINSSLRGQLRSLTYLPETFGIYDDLNETSSNIILGALDALRTLLPQAPPSSELLATLKQPFDSTVISRMPSSSRNALGVIHDYLMVSAHPSHYANESFMAVFHQKHDPEYQRSEQTVLVGLGDVKDSDEPLADFEVFLHRRGSKIPEWVNVSWINRAFPNMSLISLRTTRIYDRTSGRYFEMVRFPLHTIWVVFTVMMIDRQSIEWKVASRCVYAVAAYFQSKPGYVFFINSSTL